MKDLESHYGVKLTKRMSASRFLSRSERYKAKQRLGVLLKEANRLYVLGFYDQCFGILQNAVQLVPTDPRPYYLLGLIHEEQNNYKKAQTSFLASAMLKKNDTAMWQRVLRLSAATKDCRSRAMALEKISRRDPSMALLEEKMECFKQLRKKYWAVGCEIELFDFREIDYSVFERIKKTRHLTTMKRLCSRLVNCIRKNEKARTELFVRNTVFNLYKIKAWKSIAEMLDDFYDSDLRRTVPEIRIISFLAEWNLGHEAPKPASALPENLSPQQFMRAQILGPESLGLGMGIFESAGLCALEELDFIDDGFVGEKLIDEEAAPMEEHETRPVDGMLQEFIQDLAFWDALTEIEYVRDLACFAREQGFPLLGAAIMEKAHERENSLASLEMVGGFYLEAGCREKALACYKNLLAEDPTNIAIRSKLFSIYDSMGEPELAESYKTCMEAHRFTGNQEIEDKKEYRYKSEKCSKMRNLYADAFAALQMGPEAFLEKTDGLVSDFFGNAFVIVKNKHFRSFLNKHEKIERENGIVPFDEGLSKRKMTEKLVRVSALHGLDTEEWFFVVKNRICSLICLRKYQRAKKLARRASRAFVFRSPAFLLPICLLWTKAALHTDDFKAVAQIARKLSAVIGHSAMYYFYFLCNYVPDFYRYKSFHMIQRCLQRTAERHQQPGTRVARRGPPDTRMAQGGLPALPGAEERISPFLSACSYLPRFLFLETVDSLVDGLDSQGDWRVTALLGAISIAHTRSRVLHNKMAYAKRGVRMIHSIQGNQAMRSYNLGKAYHFCGYLAQAETHYLEAIGSGEREIRRLAIFNLSLIFKQNKSKDLLRHLLSKFYTAEDGKA